MSFFLELISDHVLANQVAGQWSEAFVEALLTVERCNKTLVEVVDKSWQYSELRF